MNFVKEFSNWFWSPNIWLPSFATWEDVNRNANWNDLWTYPFLFAGCIVIVRFSILNKFFYGPLANYCGLKEMKPRPIKANAKLEKIFNNYKTSPPEAELKQAAKDLDMEPRQIERWLRHRLAKTKVSKHSKFTECCFQLTYYILIFIYGIYVMIDKPWLYDLKNCWYNYPNHPVTPDSWWYYMISLSFYWSMVFTQFIDAKRKDFVPMLLHHLLTIFLIVFSWTCNYVRIGTVVLIVHDAADIPLHISKIFIYLKMEAMSNAAFSLFTITWMITRMGVFPFWIIHNTMFEATEIVEFFPVYYIFNSMLIVLQLMQCLWTYFIFRMIIKKFVEGKIEDERSSNEDVELTEHEKSS